MQRTWIQSLGREIPQRRKWQPTPVFLPGESHGQRILVEYSPCGHKESPWGHQEWEDTTKWLSLQHALSFKGTCPFLASEMLLGLLIVRAERGNVDRDQSQQYPQLHPDCGGSARLSLWTSCPHFPSEAGTTGTCCRETTSEAPPLLPALGNSSVVASTSASHIHNPINNNNSTATRSNCCHCHLLRPALARTIKESACTVGDLGSIPGLGRSLEGNGNPL